MTQEPIRIAKAIADYGLASRRDAEKAIERGEVQINGAIITSPGIKVTASDLIKFKTKEFYPSKPKTRIFLYHKKAGFITSNRDEKGRPTIFDDLPSNLPRLITIGRLDMYTEGLLLLTNDGEFARQMELPANEVERIYHVKVFGKLDKIKIASLKNGVIIDGIKYGSVRISILSNNNKNSWLEVKIKEGKNREVRNIMMYLDLQVTRLIRVAFGKYSLSNLKRGEIIEVI